MRNYDFECVALQIDSRPGTKEYIEQVWDKAASRLESWIKTVCISITDINGPKGGISQRCRIVIRTRTGAPIIVQETQDRISRAIHIAVRRAVHALKRNISKKQDQLKRVQFDNTHQTDFELNSTSEA
ncbi:hypothetical protein [Gimesia sp.]|uniref:hypothetical protein n=1 Tax=Gimesia sp. TaxID=2024833 RepID=UPI003A8F3777